MEKKDYFECYGERICDLCQDCIYGHKMNTNQFNLCEGSRCDDAVELFVEKLDDEKRDKRKYLLLLS